MGSKKTVECSVCLDDVPRKGTIKLKGVGRVCIKHEDYIANHRKVESEKQMNHRKEDFEEAPSLNTLVPERKVVVTGEVINSEEHVSEEYSGGVDHELEEKIDHVNALIGGGTRASIKVRNNSIPGMLPEEVVESVTTTKFIDDIQPENQGMFDKVKSADVPIEVFEEVGDKILADLREECESSSTFTEATNLSAGDSLNHNSEVLTTEEAIDDNVSVIMHESEINTETSDNQPMAEENKTENKTEEEVMPVTNTFDSLADALDDFTPVTEDVTTQGEEVKEEPVQAVEDEIMENSFEQKNEDTVPWYVRSAYNTLKKVYEGKPTWDVDRTFNFLYDHISRDTNTSRRKREQSKSNLAEAYKMLRKELSS